MALTQGSKGSNWSRDKPVKAFIWRSSRICRPTGGLPPWFFEDSLPHLLFRNNSIESGHRERQARLKIRPAPMHHLLQMTNEREHREHCPHQHAAFPLAPRPQFEVGRIPLGGMESGIAQDDHASIDLSNQPLKGV